MSSTSDSKAQEPETTSSVLGLKWGSRLAAPKAPGKHLCDRQTGCLTTRWRITLTLKSDPHLPRFSDCLRLKDDAKSLCGLAIFTNRRGETTYPRSP